MLTKKLETTFSDALLNVTTSAVTRDRYHYVTLRASVIMITDER